MRLAFLGATGSVGSLVLNKLYASSSFDGAVLVGRRIADQFAAMKNTTQTSFGFPSQPEDTEALTKFTSNVAQAVHGCDVGIVTYGAGAPSKVSKEQLRHVDETVPVEFARGAKDAGVRHMALLTSTGADSTARYNVLTGTMAGGGLYVQVKGDVENKFKEMEFESLSIFRPATLVGSPNTPKIAELLVPLFDFIVPTSFRSIHIDSLALAIAYDAERQLKKLEDSCGKPSVNIYEGQSLFDLVDEAKAAVASADGTK